MDPSALIFIALAVAWAIYLVPKALEHHEESVRTRTVEKFSATMRVLARREPISRRKARLVQHRPQAAAAQRPQARRSAAAVAAQRRRRVLGLILAAVAIVAVLAAVHVLLWVAVVIPVVVLLGWLVACRLMVRSERQRMRSRRLPVQPRRTTRPTASAQVDADETGSMPLVPEPVATAEADDAPVYDVDPTRPDPSDPESWDPVPVTLPTYVSKPVAPRSVRTIDLDSTGVWTSGRSESDSELVRDSRARTEAASDAEAARRRHA